jgi:thiol-disulfide isomerase/thioredoxin
MKKNITLVLTTLSIAALVWMTSPARSSNSSDLAPLYTAGTWLNGSATPAWLSGKVVVVDIFTFDCINCKHVVPNLRRLNADEPAARFALVGVHSPETPYERDRDNVVKNLAVQGITWPVLIDNDFRVWRAFGTEYWPTQLIFDRHGRLRKTVIGEGQDDVVNATIQSLLDER